MDAFVGRARELEVLRKARDSRRSEMIPIYGRRRVGKSELILKLITESGGLYFLGKRAPAAMQVRELLGEAARVMREPLLAEMSADDWRKALLAVVERWRGKGKLVLALDEFQWSASSSPELPSIIQECWDRHWRDSGKLLLILCGSQVGFMEREVLGKQSPLFGRRTAQIQLRPFGFHESARFHPRWSQVDQARAYFLCGGIPQYLKCLDDSKSIETNIEENLLDEFAPLAREPDFLLREELREVEVYHGVLLAIASGAGGVRDIARAAAVPERSLPYYLQQLADLGYVARRRPLSGAPSTSRQARHVLEDPLLRFWFRFVFPDLSFIHSAGPRRAFRERIAPHLDAWMGSGFERMCREALPLLYAQAGVSASHEVGEYWDKDVQVDVVGVRGDNWIDLGECRWGTVRSAKRIADELTAKLASFPNPRGASVARHAFVRTMPGRPAPGIAWHSLADLHAAARATAGAG